MADKGIICSAPMVRALLDGRKTQTRRLVKPLPLADGYYEGSAHCDYVPTIASNRPAYYRFSAAACGGGAIRTEAYEPPYAPGDRLYVREAFSYAEHQPDSVWYWADGNFAAFDCSKPKPSIHMPRWASRLTLTVTDVRVQRVQEISEADAIAEGAVYTDYGLSEPRGEASLDGGRTWVKMAGLPQPGWSMTGATRPEDSLGSAKSAFAHIWGNLHSAEGERWQDNPWIVAVAFDVARGNIDQLTGGVRG